MENNYLQIRKENFFTKIINFIRKKIQGNKEQSNNEVISCENNNTMDTQKNDFINSLRVVPEVPDELDMLREDFEKGIIDIDDLTDEQVEQLNDLYDKLIPTYEQELENQKKVYEIIKNKKTEVD